MRHFKSITPLVFLSLLGLSLQIAAPTNLFAQDGVSENEKTMEVKQDQPAMADDMRESGKIYVVVTVVLTLLAGVMVFLVLLDRRIAKLEKEIDKPQQ